MTVDEVIVVAAGLMLVAGIGSPLIAWAFCVRPAPRWLRIWRDLALAVLATRVLLRLLDGAHTDWWSAAAWLHVAVAGMVIFAFNWHSVLGPGGDRCGR